MGIVSAVIAFFKGLPILRDMLKTVGAWFTSMKNWWDKYRFGRDRRRIDEAMEKAIKDKNTEDLQKEMGKKL